jgi:hypothetical protein
MLMTPMTPKVMESPSAAAAYFVSVLTANPESAARRRKRGAAQGAVRGNFRQPGGRKPVATGKSVKELGKEKARLLAEPGLD